MKKIITLTFGLFLGLSMASTASAQVYSQTYPNGYNYNTTILYCSGAYGGYGYNNNYNCGNNYNNSYTYTSGCYTYYYNGYTRTTSIVSYNCQNSYTYTNPTTYTYYTSPYYTYQYSHGTWYPQYSNNYFYGYGNYSNGYVYTPQTNCYYVNGYYTCQ